MIDSKAKRAAALGYGLSFLLVLPPAHGGLSIEDAGHALSAYRYDMPAATPAHPNFVIEVRSDVGIIEVSPDVGVIEVH